MEQVRGGWLVVRQTETGLATQVAGGRRMRVSDMSEFSVGGETIGWTASISGSIARVR